MCFFLYIWACLKFRGSTKIQRKAIMWEGLARGSRTPRADGFFCVEVRRPGWSSPSSPSLICRVSKVRQLRVWGPQKINGIDFQHLHLYKILFLKTLAWNLWSFCLSFPSAVTGMCCTPMSPDYLSESEQKGQICFAYLNVISVLVDC